MKRSAKLNHIIWRLVHKGQTKQSKSASVLCLWIQLHATIESSPLHRDVPDFPGRHDRRSRSWKIRSQFKRRGLRTYFFWGKEIHAWPCLLAVHSQFPSTKVSVTSLSNPSLSLWSNLQEKCIFISTFPHTFRQGLTSIGSDHATQ